MIDSERFPQGDVATWIPSDVETHEATALRLIRARVDEDTARHLTVGGLRHRSSPFSDGHLIDIVTGLPFRWDRGGPHLAIDAMYRSAHDVVDARFFRLALTGAAPRGLTVLDGPATGGAVDRLASYGRKRDLSFLSAPIVDYSARSVAECEEILDEIDGLLSRGPYFRRLWLRGQRHEYTMVRAEEVALLHVGDEPSLVPSLGRYALSHPGEVDTGLAFNGPNHTWKKPFLLWLIRQNPQWLAQYPAFARRLEASLRSADDTEFATLLLEIRMDPRVPDEVDDLRQRFFVYFTFDIFVWVLQQYGYLASVLDLTDDLDVALFFAQAEMLDGAFHLPEAEEGRLIYVFAESRQTTSFQDATQIAWGDEEWVSTVPLRLAAQKAGCLVGSTFESQNLYGNLVVARIWLTGTALTSRTVTSIFPPRSEDLLLKTLLDARPRPEGLY